MQANVFVSTDDNIDIEVTYENKIITINRKTLDPDNYTIKEEQMSFSKEEWIALDLINDMIKYKAN